MNMDPNNQQPFYTTTSDAVVDPSYVYKSSRTIATETFASPTTVSTSYPLSINANVDADRLADAIERCFKKCDSPLSAKPDVDSSDGLPKIKRVIFNPPATIVLWNDNTKTIVKTSDRDEFDEEFGLAMAIAKRYFGCRSKFLKTVENASRPQERDESTKTIKDSILWSIL